jgi:hypothetical protein
MIRFGVSLMSPWGKFRFETSLLAPTTWARTSRTIENLINGHVLPLASGYASGEFAHCDVLVGECTRVTIYQMNVRRAVRVVAAYDTFSGALGEKGILRAQFRLIGQSDEKVTTTIEHGDVVRGV